MTMQRVLVGVMLLALGFAAGCSTSPCLSGMVYEAPPKTFKATGKSVFVTEAPDALQCPAMPQTQFAEALRTSIQKAGLLTVSEDPTKADYHLLSSITEYRPPTGGTVMTAHLTVRYTLKRPEAERPTWHDEIAVVKQCGVQDAFVGTTRVRITAEGAAQKSIAGCLEKLSALDL